MKIEIFGVGCENCQRLEKNVRRAVREMGIRVEIDKIEDFETLLRRGITATPGLVIDGEIVLNGRVPHVDEIKEIIESMDEGTPRRTVINIGPVRSNCGCSRRRG